MTAVYLLLAVFALWVRHTDFKLVLKPWLLRIKGETSYYDKWSNSQSLFYDHHKEADHQYDIEMLELESIKVGTNVDELNVVGETSCKNPHASEPENPGQSCETVEQHSPGTGDKQLFHAAEDPMNDCLGTSHNKSAVASIQQPKVIGAAPAVSADSTSNIPLQLSTKTKQRKSSWPTGVTSEQSSPQRGSLGFQSKFLNDNEDHVIWKPKRSKSLLNRRLSTRSRGSDCAKSMAKPKNDDGISQMSEISPSLSDYRLRQQQLLERVNMAREVTKDQNNDLYQPEMSQEDKKKALKLASQYVSYCISQKPRSLSDVVFQAMDKNKSASLVNTDRPLTVKEKWQKITVLASTATPPHQSETTLETISTSRLGVINKSEGKSADNIAQLDSEVDGELESKEQVVSPLPASPTNTMDNAGNANNSPTVMDDQAKTVLF